MAYGYDGRSGSTAAAVLDGFQLSPLPYPVLLILAVISVFLGIQWYVNLEEAVESAEEQTNWALLAVPVLLIIAARWLSSLDDPRGLLFGLYDGARRRRIYYGYLAPGEGGSPWGVAAVIVLLLVLLHFQSGFLDSWLV